MLNLAHTGEKQLNTLLLRRATGSASADDEAPCLPSWGRTIFTVSMKHAPTQTTVRAIKIHDVRTVLHYDTYICKISYLNHRYNLQANAMTETAKKIVT